MEEDGQPKPPSFSEAMHTTHQNDVEVCTLFHGHEVRVVSTWTQDVRMYIDGACKGRSIKRIPHKKTRILSTTLCDGSDEYLVEVFAKALLSVKLQVCINGRQIAGELI